MAMRNPKFEKVAISKDKMWSLFQNPPNEYRMTPFWFWNYVMKREELDSQLANFREHGIGGCVAHARHGRLTPYLSEEWMQVTRDSAVDAKKRGMYFWLYDEDNWPSGTCGNALKDIKHGIKVIGLSSEVVISGPTRYEADNSVLDTPRTRIYKVLAIPFEEGPDPWSESPLAKKLSFVSEKILQGKIGGKPNDIKDITPPSGGKKITWNAPEGTWLIATFVWSINPNHLNTLNRALCQDFIHSTHEKYAKSLEGIPGLFPGAVPGIFTDEPSFDSTSKQKFFGRAITWDEDAELQFKRHVTDVPFWQALPFAFYEGGVETSRLRVQIWESITQAYIQAFHGEIFDYCESMGWISTGHLKAEGSFPDAMRNQGDVFLAFEKMHIPGIDQLTTALRLEGIQFPYKGGNPYRDLMQDNMFSGKLASSAAHLLDKPRVVSECFGTSGWSLTLEGQKRLVDWAIASGIDYFVPRAFAYSIDGVRKRDHPPSFHHQPYYTHYGTLANYAARLAAIFSTNKGNCLARVALLYPSKSFWKSFTPLDTPVTHVLSQDFSHITDLLFRNQLEFDFINEELLQTAALTTEGKLKKGSGEYDVVLLPPLLVIGEKTIAALERFVKAGGKVIAIGALPMGTTDKGDTPEFQGKLERLFGVAPAKIWESIRTQKPTESDVHINTGGSNPKGKWIFLEESMRPLYGTNFYKIFRRVLNEQCPRDLTLLAPTAEDVEAAPAYVVIHHRVHEGVHYIFLANPTISEIYKDVEVTIAGVGRLELWDPLAGKKVIVKGMNINDQKTRIWLDFPPYSSYLFVLDPSQPPSTGEVVDYSHKLVRPVLERTMTLRDNWKIRAENPNVFVFEDNVTFRSLLQSKNQSNPLKGIFPNGDTNSRLQWEVQFDCGNPTLLKPIKIVLDGLIGDQSFGERADYVHFLEKMAVFVNGKSAGLSFPKEKEYIDRFWIVCDVSPMIIEGRNKVTIESCFEMTTRFNSIYEPIRITGNFEVDSSSNFPKLLPRDLYRLRQIDNRGWSSLGFPRYWGALTYEQEIHLGGDYDKYEIILEIPGMDNATEIFLEDKQVEILPWRKNSPAYTVNLTPFLKLDVVKLGIKVYGTAESVMEKNIVPGGLTEPPQLKFYSK